MTTLRLDMSHRETRDRHPNRVMQQLGIQYDEGEILPNTGYCIYTGCREVPEPLPVFLRELSF